MFSSRSLQSAAAFLVYACEPVWRASELNRYFLRRSILTEREAIFSGRSLQPAASLLVCYACQRVGRATWVNVFFRYRCSISPGQGRGELADFGGSLPSADTCQQDWRGCALNRVFVSSAVKFSRGGGARGKGFWWIASLRVGALVYACQRVGRASVLIFFFLCLRRSIFSDRGAVFLGDLYNRRWRY